MDYEVAFSYTTCLDVARAARRGWMHRWPSFRDLWR